MDLLSILDTKVKEKDHVGSEVKNPVPLNSSKSNTNMLF